MCLKTQLIHFKLILLLTFRLVSYLSMNNITVKIWSQKSSTRLTNPLSSWMVHFSNSNLHHNLMKKYSYYSLNNDQSTEIKSCIEKMDPVGKIYVNGTFPYF